MERIKTRTGEFFVDGDGILNAIMSAGIIVDYEDAVDNFLVMKNLNNGQSMLRLIDLTNDPKFHSKAKKFSENKDLQTFTKARALLTENNLKKISFNFFTRINPGKIPTKFFTDRADAVEWLKSFL